MNYLGIALSAVCLYFIIRGLRSKHDKNNTIVALYFTVFPLLGMMVGDAYTEIKNGPIDLNLLVPGRPDPSPLLAGVVIGFLIASICYPFLRKKKERRPPNQAL
jgi:hypothetical protein